MSQNVQLAVSGVYTAPSDLAGLPPGALDEAVNVESRYRNTLEPRPGFESVTGSEVTAQQLQRLGNFMVNGVNRRIALATNGTLYYHNGSTWVAFSGLATGITQVNALAKPRFIKGDQNLYVTALDGVLSLSSGTSAAVLRAGVPDGLDLTASTTGSNGWFGFNSVLATTATTTNTSLVLTNVTSVVGLSVGNYVSGTNIPAGAKIASITTASSVVVTGNTIALPTAGNTDITNVLSITGIAVGQTVSGTGIQTGTTVTAISAGPPYTIGLSSGALLTQTAQNFTFQTKAQVTMSVVATGTASSVAVTFYAGAQVGYRMVFGRTEIDSGGKSTLRLSAPSAMAIATNITAAAVNASITGTIPKNASSEITFVQLYRSAQTAGATITPLEQMTLVYERVLVAGDFTARVITVTDSTPNTVVGAALYAGTDQEGILQSNNPPPACWDMAIFNNFALYGNITQPPTLSVTVLAVGAPTGIQTGDVITITHSAGAVRTYTAAAAENKTSREFRVFSTGSPSQDLVDTAKSLISVVNYDEVMPVHMIYASSSNDLPGQITFIGDKPVGTFTVTTSLNAAAYDPALTNLASDVNYTPNGVCVSKSGELDAVPQLNLKFAGDSSAKILRMVPLRDFVVIFKEDGIYKGVGDTPATFQIVAFDATTVIIGPDTAQALNASVYCLSNQGVVSVSDAGVDAKSVPIDDAINSLIGSSYDNINQYAFATGYESARKYILSMPQNSVDNFSSIQRVYNYVTNSWTSWNRNLKSSVVDDVVNKLYIGRSDDLDDSMSSERKTGTYRDFADESISVTVSTVTNQTTLILASVTGVVAGDIMYQSDAVWSPITSVNVDTRVIVTQYSLPWVTGASSVVKAFECRITWKQVFADNPATTKQFQEGQVLFKKTRFNNATLSFVTDFSTSLAEVPITSELVGAWGLFPWGQVPWGGVSSPRSVRFYIPRSKQFGSYIKPTIEIAQAWSDFKIQGMAIAFDNISQEVGR